MAQYDLIVGNGSVLVPWYAEPLPLSIGIRDGKITVLAEELERAAAADYIDAQGMVVLPGAVDSHFHLGIYRPLEMDAESETLSSVAGGTTTVLSYFRTGSHYLNKVGPYREIFPEVCARVSGRAHTDYAFHLAPMTPEHIDEIPWLVREGVTSFKFYMFYQGLNLAASSTDAAAYTMTESYDLGHLLSIMEAVASASQRSEKGRVSLSLHCENAQLIKLFIDRVKGKALAPLEEYSAARPPLTERLSIHEAGVLASATDVRANLLHLSSRESLRGVSETRRLYPHLDIRAETTLHHLCLSYESVREFGARAKVNPPIRGSADADALWHAVADGTIQWVASDHACCLEELKGDDLWQAQPGFGGTALLYPALISEGHYRRGLSWARVVELASSRPAKAYGLYPRKGAIAVGSDADLTIVDPNQEEVVTPELLLSAQEYTPFAGMKVRGWPQLTLLRGKVAYERSGGVTEPAGEFLRRPLLLGGRDEAR